MNSPLLETADRIGARLCRDALWSHGRCNWTSDYLDGDALSHGALGPGVYSGTSGIALFLWRLAGVTGERIFRITAEGALRQALTAPPMPGCSFYSGGLGVHWVALQIRGEVNEEAVIQQATPDRPQLDVIGGSAGAIAALLALHERTQLQRLIELAIQHGDLLLDEASRTEEGWSWKTIPAERNLTGFSHGTAGIGWALLELYRATNEDRFRSAALEAFRYDQSWFHAGERNWPDFREVDTAYPAYWCHGAAGIGFSRLRAWQILPHEEILREARIALETVRRDLGSAGNYSLCHGECGNADLLIYAAEVTGQDSWLDAVHEIAQQGNERFEQRRVPWPCGLPDANETPGLMLGLAGIGYFYLRAADPKQIPSVLIPGFSKHSV